MVQVTVGLRIGAAGAVSVVLNCLAHSSKELLYIWRHHSAQVINKGKRRRDAAEAAAYSIPSGICGAFLRAVQSCKAGCGRAAFESSTPIPRSIARAVLIGQRRHQHASTARKEQRWAAQKQSEAVVQTSGESIASSGCRRRCSTAT